MHRKSKALWCCFALITVFLSQASAQSRGPSTAEERARVVQIAKSLRTDPTATAVQSDREWLLKWLIEVPDVSISLCPAILGDLGNSKTGYPGALLATMMASQAAFVIENPNKAKDKSGAYLAGLEGALDGYQAIQAKDQNYRLPNMDDLLRKRADGKLQEYLRSATKRCK